MASLPDSLSEVLTEVRAIIKEPTELFWRDTEINNWAKEGVVDICAKTLCYKAIDSSQAFTNSMIEYPVPTLAFKILSCEFYDSQASPVSYRGLIRIHPRQIQHETPFEPGDPGYWYHFADRIGIYPVPASTNGSDRLIIHYALTTDDITNLPDRFQTFVIYYAAAMALFKRRKNQGAVTLYSSYLNSVKFARIDLENLEAVDTKDQQNVYDFTVRGQ